ncbi:MAG: chemotaxis-specific protein-glutamate methyltransferase CheB [Chloroflexi bacterium]|nr:MAG: chemotaxis-specific protein-glutamate methyltransferase CheB [Chloroflexota bacterium]
MNSDASMTNGEIRVLLADDSPTIRRHLATMINATPGMKVIGEARDGAEALALVQQLQPDVVSMDIRMPGMDGLQATRLIMEQHPTPVVVVSGVLTSEVELSFRAIQAGALAVVEKPPDRRSPAFEEKYRRLVTTLAAMSKVSLVARRIPLAEQSTLPTTGLLRSLQIPEVVAIGASAGGPSALSRLLGALPAEFPLPIVVVQHMPPEFIYGLARWLDKSTSLGVCVAHDGQALEAGVVHLSPGDAHLTLARKDGELRAKLVMERGTYRYQPAVDMLFESVAQVCGGRSMGIVLTGMGDDGARGLKAIRDAGGHTLAQDRASSTVFGMPSAAIEAGAVQYVVSLTNIPSTLLKLVR